jgi:hypothetical protein
MQIFKDCRKSRETAPLVGHPKTVCGTRKYVLIWCRFWFSIRDQLSEIYNRKLYMFVTAIKKNLQNELGLNKMATG